MRFVRLSLVVAASAACGARTDLGNDQTSYPDVSTTESAATDGTPSPDGGVTVLTPGTAKLGPLYLAVDSASIYWTDNTSAVMKCPKTGCGGSPVVLASAQAGATSIAIDATNAYWVNFDTQTVMSCALAGCGNNPTMLVNNACGEIVVDATNVYWVTCDNAIAKCAKGGCGGSSTLLVPSDPSDMGPPLRSLTSDATHLYWSTSDGRVMRCTSDNCIPALLASSASSLGGLTVNQTSAYWSTFGDSQGTMWSCSLDGCASPAMVTSSTGDSLSLDTMTVDTTNLYWTASKQSGEALNGLVMKCAVGGCSAPTLMAQYQIYSFSIVVDETNVYWTDPQSGIIATLPK